MQLSLEIDDHLISIDGFTGTESIAHPFKFLLKITAQKAKQIKQSIGKPAVLTLTLHEDTRRWTGIITKATITKITAHGLEAELTMESELCQLNLNHAPYTYVDETLEDIFTETFKRHPSLTICVSWQNKEPITVPFIQQWGHETDLQFLQRLLTTYDLWWRPIHNGDGYETWLIYSINDPLLEKNSTVFELITSSQQRHSSISHQFLLKSCTETGLDQSRHFTLSTYSPLDIGKIYLHNAVSDNSGLPAQFIPYDIIHQVSLTNMSNANPSHLLYQGTIKATATLQTLKNDEASYSPPSLTVGHIESDHAYAATSNERYKVKFLHDHKKKEPFNRSTWLPRLQPFGGLTSEISQESIGLHYPLYDGAEVLIGYLNEKPQYPIIIGTSPSNTHPNRITCDNQNTSIWQSQQMNTLAIELKNNKKTLDLETHQQQTHLKFFDLESSSGLSLANQKSHINWQAQQAIHFKALNIRQSMDVSSKVSATTYDVKCESGDIQLQSKAAMTVETGQLDTTSKSLEIFSDQVFQIQAGSLSIQAQKELFNLKGRKVELSGRTIKLKLDANSQFVWHTKTSGIKLSANGKISLFGQSINLSAASIACPLAFHSPPCPIAPPALLTSILAKKIIPIEPEVDDLDEVINDTKVKESIQDDEFELKMISNSYITSI